MATHISKVFRVFAILVLVASVQLMDVEGSCSAVVGNCALRDCKEHCSSLGAIPGQWSCSFLGLCTCIFSHGPPPMQPSCGAGYGLCSANCGDQCCNSKCARKFNRGTGRCYDFANLNFCLCSYDG